ncbi:hypothetical protein BDK51DRAFT_51057 [Blyttiomyces helicus]|uniref:Uncharacterized protein n=1 Tax=Blyttiomyces helicus TaxID=388810 RepID=A0A4P9W6V3_9FUNG|nr:hypothetical protein BDK51DRAFT_51057 [Blyttiomyces helicus]|eukprot:RKO87752.1 hypothetical protein BDK51DRAFT_51057 [Blyttiomyces helicus]
MLVRKNIALAKRLKEAGVELDPTRPAAGEFRGERFARKGHGGGYRGEVKGAIPYEERFAKTTREIKARLGAIAPPPRGPPPTELTASAAETVPVVGAVEPNVGEEKGADSATTIKVPLVRQPAQKRRPPGLPSVSVLVTSPTIAAAPQPAPLAIPIVTVKPDDLPASVAPATVAVAPEPAPPENPIVTVTSVRQDTDDLHPPPVSAAPAPAPLDTPIGAVTTVHEDKNPDDLRPVLDTKPTAAASPLAVPTVTVTVRQDKKLGAAVAPPHDGPDPRLLRGRLENAAHAAPAPRLAGRS